MDDLAAASGGSAAAFVQSQLLVSAVNSSISNCCIRFDDYLNFAFGRCGDGTSLPWIWL
jgi:hypothetical protein